MMRCAARRIAAVETVASSLVGRGRELDELRRRSTSFSTAPVASSC
jgi:hypothetical protein